MKSQARRLPGMSSSDRPLLQIALDGACAPQVAEARPARAPGGEPGAPVRRSPLANPKFGLAWSNSSASNEVLVRAAIKHGAFHLLLEAVLGHGIQFVEGQLALMLSDEEVSLSSRAKAELRRKLANIKRGLAAAGYPDQG